jgi:pyrroloquinoline-quinone synthase
LTRLLSDSLDTIIAQRGMLDHPFYQAWNAGTLPIEAMREYVKQYFHFEAAFPTFLSAIHARMEAGPARQAVLQNLWDEEHGENNHLALWLRFCEALGVDEAEVRAGEPNPETRDLVEGFRQACSEGTVVEGLATLYAYESQAPAVSDTKIAGLKKHYGFEDPAGYEFFTVHRDVDTWHADTEKQTIDASAAEERTGIEQATEVAAGRLWKFLDGAYAGATC